MLEGFRREVTANELCRREGIKPHSYYAWTKEFTESAQDYMSRTNLSVKSLDLSSLVGTKTAVCTPTHEKTLT